MTANRIESESFSSVDAAWLHMDRPTNLAVITGVITFSGQMDIQRLKDTLAQRMLIHKRFLQRAREPDHRLGLPRWELDPNFDIDHHLQTISLPEPADQDALQQLVGEMISLTLDPDRPLWVFYVVDNYFQGSALICRLHHCIADGLALVQVLLAMADLDPDAEWTGPLPEIEEQEDSLLEQLFRPAFRVARTIGHTWRTAENLVHGGFETLTHPSRLRSAAHFSKEATLALGKLLLIPPDRRTGLRGKCGISKRAVWSSDISLDEIKRIGHLMGGTVNDILLSALTGAFRRYLEERGETIDGLNIRSILPVNLRPPDELDQMGNRFGLVFLSLPVGTQDPLRRLVTLKRRMNAIKDTPEAVVAFGILGAIGLSPTQLEDLIISIFGMKGTAVITNVPGPRQPLYFAGQKIETLMFWVPTPANLAVGVSIISYAGQVILGITTDEGLIPDPENILRSFYDELDYLSRWGRPSSGFAEQPQQDSDAGAADATEQPPAGEPAPGETHAAREVVKCQALTRSGKPCKNHALPGETTCYVHRPLTVEDNVR
jgi:diacylglycerol O-acyltransferase / wax synthase